MKEKEQLTRRVLQSGVFSSSFCKLFVITNTNTKSENVGRVEN
jgi:hypothetical protein